MFLIGALGRVMLALILGSFDQDGIMYYGEMKLMVGVAENNRALECIFPHTLIVLVSS